MNFLTILIATIISAKNLCIAADITEFRPYTIVIGDDRHHIFDYATYHAKDKKYEISLINVLHTF